MAGTRLAAAIHVARWFLAVPIGLVSILVLLVPFMMVVGSGERISKDRAYLAEFEWVAQKVEGFQQANQRLPEYQEFSELIKTQDEWPPVMFLNEAAADAPAPFQPDQSPPGGFTLSFWRGEWMEYYASATHQTTLLTSAGAYWEALAFQAVCWLVIGSTGIFIAWFVRGPRTHRLMSDQSEKT